MQGRQVDEEFLTVSYTLDLPFRYAAGPLLSRFYWELRENGRLVANRCPRCGRLLFPPLVVCGRCHVRATEEFVELSSKGTVLDYTVVLQPIQDPTTGKMREEKYPHATILLDDGVSFTHRLAETDIAKLRVGMRVEAVFRPKEERQGHMTDIIYFRTIEESGKEGGRPWMRA